MKKLSVAVSVIAAALPFVLLAVSLKYSYADFPQPAAAFEFLCYFSVFIASLLFGRRLSSKDLKPARRLSAAALRASVYTLVIFLFNNLIRFVQINSIFGFDGIPVPFLLLLKSDVTYGTGIGPYRYPLVFTLFFIPAVLLPFLRKRMRPVVDKKAGAFLSKYIWFDDTDRSLETLICLFLRKRISSAAVREYCETMEINEAGAAELMRCIDLFDMEFLYVTLLDRFGGVISEEKRLYYESRYRSRSAPVNGSV